MLFTSSWQDPQEHAHAFSNMVWAMYLLTSRAQVVFQHPMKPSVHNRGGNICKICDCRRAARGSKTAPWTSQSPARVRV